MDKATEMKEYRDSKRAEMGDEAFKAKQAADRKLRRLRAKHGLRPPQSELEKVRGFIQMLEDLDKPAKVPQIKEIMQDRVNVEAARKEKVSTKLVRRIWRAKKAMGSIVKEASVKAQLAKVMNLRDIVAPGATGFEWLRDTNAVKQAVNTNPKWKTDNTRNSQYQAIASILVVIKGFDKAFKFYSDLSTRGRKKITANAEKNVLTAREQKGILPWHMIRKLSNTAISKQDRALIGLYTLLPPRRVKDVSLLTIANKDDNGKNILLIGDGGPEKVIWNKYKTERTFGKQRIPLPKRLKALLKSYIGKRTSGPLFPTTDGGYHKNFSRQVTRAFYRASGKPITANLLRHSFITDYLHIPRSIAARRKIAAMMGHGIQTQEYYRRLDLSNPSWDN